MAYGKRLILCCACLLAATVYAQESPGLKELTGLWTGLMYNDTTELNYRYEIAISEKHGKLTGYSHTYFILDNREYYGVKKIKITVDGNKLITQDLKLVANDYPVKPPKGVYVINVLNFEMKNGVMVLSGMFSTNQTRQYAPATGYIHVEKKADFMQSSLVPKLEELGLADELAFVAEEKQKPVKTVVQTGTVTEPPVAKAKPVEKEKPVMEKPEKPKAETETVVKTKPVKPKAETETVVKPKPDKHKAAAETEVKEKPVTETVGIKQEPQKATTPASVSAGADINKRIIETIQSVNYTSDSLVLTLYDNGEVDGDTVTVLMNGEVIMPRVGLSTNAVRKTIYTKDVTDSIQIVMYAENLGSLPPNTGLLIVNDGKERYEIRFSGDLKKNAAIVFRKKQTD